MTISSCIALYWPVSVSSSWLLMM